MPANQRPSRNIIFEDAHSIAQAHFSKTVVKGVKLDLKTNTLVQTDKTVGYAKDRGFTGILEYLDPTQERIFLLEKTGVALLPGSDFGFSVEKMMADDWVDLIEFFYISFQHILCYQNALFLLLE